MYECIKDKDTEVNGFLDLSIQLTESELAITDIAHKQTDGPNFMICNPVSIRPSQLPMNVTNIDDTTTNDNVEQVEDSLKEFKLDISKSEPDVKQEDIIIVEDTEDFSKVCNTVPAANPTRKETERTSFKNRYATNPKLNETISAVKEIDPFDNHLQNALLDDIDFIDYVKSLEYVQMVTRVRPIELNTDIEIGNEQFNISTQIGQGSFGFVYR